MYEALPGRIFLRCCARLLLAHIKIYRSAGEVPLLANLVFQIASVRLLHPLRQVAEEHKRRDALVFKHCDILYLHIFALACRWRICAYHLLHIVVELRCGHDALAVVVDLHSRFQHLVYALLCERGCEDDREVGKRRETVAYRRLEMLYRRRALILHKVPFVDTDNEPLLVFLNEREKCLRPAPRCREWHQSSGCRRRCSRWSGWIGSHCSTRYPR